MLHTAVVLYRRTITFSCIVSTNRSRLRIPTQRLHTPRAATHDGQQGNAVQARPRLESAPLVSFKIFKPKGDRIAFDLNLVFYVYELAAGTPGCRQQGAGGVAG